LAKGVYRLCSGLLAAVLFSLTVVPCYAAEGSMGGGSFGGGAGRSDFFTWTNGFGGGSFGGGASRDEAAAAYDTYVQDLPATGYTSTGGLLWQPTASDVVETYYYKVFSKNAVTSYFSTVPFSEGGTDVPNLLIDYLSDENGFSVSAGPARYELYVYIGFSLRFLVPLSGSYRRIASPQSRCNVVMSTGPLSPVTSSYEAGSFKRFITGNVIGDDSYFRVTDELDKVSYFSAEWYFPVYEVIGGLIEKLLSGVGNVVGGIVKGILALLTKAVEAVAGIGELFTSLVSAVTSLFSGFTGFLAAVFPFFPPEVFTILELGLILMVAAAVLKKWLL